jgi:hypothetical protein
MTDDVKDDSQKIDSILISLRSIQRYIDELGSHRKVSLAQTKIDEAAHWLTDRRAECGEGFFYRKYQGER